MVERRGTAAILHGATPRSLLLFDEIGRGTSTYDGMAIARAVVEFIHNRPELAAKTLFAPHYPTTTSPSPRRAGRSSSSTASSPAAPTAPTASTSPSSPASPGPSSPA